MRLPSCSEHCPRMNASISSCVGCSTPLASFSHTGLLDIRYLPSLLTPDDLGSYIPRLSRGGLPIESAKLLHTTRHSFTNGLRTHLENVAYFFVTKTIAKVKLQNR